MTTASGTSLSEAEALRGLGFSLCKPDPDDKKPTYPGWPTRSLEPDDFAPGDLIGILGGPLSDGNKPGHALVIIDLDTADAIAKADDFLPPTAMEEGRQGKPRDHRYFLVPVETIPPWAESKAEQGAAAAKKATGHAGPFKKQFRHVETDTCVIDFIGTGGQVVCPGGGGVRQWAGGEPGEPAVVPFPELWEAVCKLAVACGCKLPEANGNGQHESFPMRMKATSGPDRVSRAIAYLGSCPPAIDGQGGHNQTFYVARAIVWGFELGPEVGFDLLWNHYNPTCQGPWTEKELRHKCEDADTKPFNKPRGWLLHEERPEWRRADFEDFRSNGDGDPSGADPSGPMFNFLTSADFARSDIRLEWFVKRLMVKGQPCVIGGPRKSLKTSLLVDLAISLGTGTPFLGHFDTYRKVRVAVMSGESGQATLKETACRICKAKGVQLEDADVLWEFKLPQLADLLHMGQLKRALEAAQAEMVVVDPLYLSLVASGRGQGPQASNLYQMGAAFLGVAQACLSVGCTPVLAHHFKITRPDATSEPQLEDLAYSGIQEFARQWVLLGRREAYEPGSGLHRLWLTVGGSAGQSGLWTLDIDEGELDESFRGRKWDVTVGTASEARKSKRAEKAESRLRQDHEDDGGLLAALDRLDPNRKGASNERVRIEARLSRDRMERAVNRLRAAEIIEPVQVTVIIGNGGERPAAGVRRLGGEE